MRTVNQLINMSGKTTLVTGATGAIGQVIAVTIAELCGNLILVDKPESNYEPLINKLKKHSCSINCIDCDLEIENQRIKLVQTINENQLPVDVLINNAAFVGSTGLQGWVTSFEDQTIDTWRRALEVNLTAAFDLSKGLYPLLKKSGNGSIINISSIYGVSGPVHSMYEGTKMGNPAAYSVSKGGLIQLTRWMATTIAPDVRVNSVSPGGVLRYQPQKFIERYQDRTPLSRMAKEEDFKGIIAYLASDMSEYVTGQNINVDGGWGVW